MAYDEALESRILAAIDGWGEANAKKRFGGVCHLILGNIFCGVCKEFLILRLGETVAAKALTRPHIRRFDITGRPMKGWVMVEPEGIETEEALNAWLKKVRPFALTLAPKLHRRRS